MAEVNSKDFANQQNYNINQTVTNIQPEKIDSVFITYKQEHYRGSFNNTFKDISINASNNTHAKMFYQGIIENKESLCQDLGLEPEEYDALSCIALTLASQETGMGHEMLYNSENNGSPYDSVRDSYIEHKNEASASSGLTQMKVYDFMYSPYVDENIKKNFEKYGIEAYNMADDNLYYNPEKSAVATIILLSDIASKNYNKYINTLNEAHSQIKNELDSNLDEEQCVNKGLDILTSLQDVYENLSDSKKENFRNAFKNWFLSYNGFENTEEYRKEHPEQNNKKYFEDENLKKFNKILQKSGIKLEQKDLDYIRYALTAPGAEMTSSQYCMYAWNKGVGGCGYQLDRLLSEKLGEFFPSQNMDFDLYTYNAQTILEQYAIKAGVTIDTIDDVLNEYAKKSA